MGTLCTIQQYGDWYTGRWRVGCYIWYIEEGPGWATAPPSLLLAVPHVTAHPSTASVITSYYSMWHYNYGRPLSVAWAKSMLCFANAIFLFIFLWPPYAPAEVNGGSRNFYTWWTLSVNREVTTWIVAVLFSWSSLNYRVGQKVTKFGIFSDPARKHSALTPERGRIL